MHLHVFQYPDTSSPHFLLVNESGNFLTFSEGTLTLSDDDSGFEKLFRFYFIKPSALQKRKTPSPKPEATPADTVDKKVRFSPEVSTAIPRPKSVEPSNALVPIDNIKRPRSTGPQGRLHTNGRFGYRDNDRRPMSENMGVRRPPGPAEDTWPRRPPSPENFDRRHPRHSAPSRPSSREGFRRPGPRSEAKSGATFAPHEPSYPAHRLPPSQIPTQDEELRQLKEFKEAPKNYNPNNNSNLSIPVAIKDSKDRTLCKTTKKSRLYQWEKVEMGKYSDSSAFFHVHYVELKKGGGVELKEFIDLNKANGKPVALRSVENGKFMCLWDGGEIGEQTDLRDNAIWIFKKLPHSPLAFALHSNSDNQFFSVENNHVRANSQKIGINQSFTFFVPPTLQQAVAQQSRPQIGKGMLGVTVAITGASLMGASAAIVQMVLNINRTNNQANQAATSAPHNTGANPANHPAPAPPNDPTFGNNPHWLGPDPSVTGGGWGIPTMNPNGTPVTPQAGNVPPPTMPGRPVDPTGPINFGPAPGG
ncbi:hypothetical protein BKA69DRAFT_259467 [Paraphysoderma sedebokerense]|nr:hypothetical protein BKA69DRAFT_259467 [Paraphysoderma sedebokerense]